MFTTTSLKYALALALYATITSFAVAAQGTAGLSSVSCGNNRYTKQQIDAATAEGCRLSANNQQLGNSRYPHQFNNREGLVFPASGPYQEFPILSGGAVYSGGAPGADRIVFNPNYQGSCTFIGAMTHTGAAQTNGFVSCSVSRSSVVTTTTSSSLSSSSAAKSTSSASKTSSGGPTATTTGPATTSSSSASPFVVMGGQGLVAWLLSAAWMLAL
ncbi:Ribonuclease/ribotoxin [Podospora didyma]|uniref:ribonuclease T1 n=1 Tax=Podospora didyma TaxID=330526 RepID=A0AAE0U6Y9_9PEZI|nr:Ribonuclease/ribotoxin [Podospora didyma]